jgi:hypothetical protein
MFAVTGIIADSYPGLSLSEIGGTMIEPWTPPGC